MGTELFIVVGLFPVELLACQVSMVGFTSAKLKEDYMTERLSTSKLSLKLVTPPLLLSIRFPLVTTSNGTILRS